MPLEPTHALEAVDQGCAFVRRAPADLLLLQGRDARDLVHRIAASEVRDLDERGMRRVIFTDDKGRVIDAPVVWREGEDALAFLAGPSRGPALLAWIDRWILMEDARIAPHDARVAFDLVGSTSLDAARTVAEQSDADVRVLSPGPVPADGLLAGIALVPSDRADRAHAALAATLVPVDDDVLAAWCARAGVARPGPGLAAGCHPLELGWKPWVSFTKGCYIGQEVVARLDTYDKVKRTVAALRTDASTPIGTPTGTVVRHQGKKVGVVLESAWVDGRGHAVAVIDVSVENGAALELEDAGAGTLVRIPAP